MSCLCVWMPAVAMHEAGACFAARRESHVAEMMGTDDGAPDGACKPTAELSDLACDRQTSRNESLTQFEVSCPASSSRACAAGPAHPQSRWCSWCLPAALHGCAPPPSAAAPRCRQCSGCRGLLQVGHAAVCDAGSPLHTGSHARGRGLPVTAAAPTPPACSSGGGSAAAATATRPAAAACRCSGSGGRRRAGGGTPA